MEAMIPITMKVSEVLHLAPSSYLLLYLGYKPERIKGPCRFLLTGDVLTAVCAAQGYPFKLAANYITKNNKCFSTIDTLGKCRLSHLGDVMRTQTSQRCGADRIYAIPHILPSHLPGLTIIFAKTFKFFFLIFNGKSPNFS